MSVTEGTQGSVLKEVTEFCLIGCVDSGKSTLSGQLLSRAGYIEERELEKIFTKAEEDGMSRWKYARILDIYEEEAARGKTHEFIKIDFDYNGRPYRLVDTPGHGIFIRSMITGVYGVKIAGIIIPMPNNEFQATFKGGVLKEHLIIAKASGIEKVILLANKMDEIAWNKEEFQEKIGRVEQFLQKVGYQKEDLITIPMAAFHGIGLTDREGLPEWYTGPTFMEALDRQGAKIDCGRPADSTTSVPLEGKQFLLDTRIVNCESIMTLGFSAILHIAGEEYPAELVGLKNGCDRFIKNGDKCYTIWRLDRQVTLPDHKVLIRARDATIGLGKVIKPM